MATAFVYREGKRRRLLPAARSARNSSEFFLLSLTTSMPYLAKRPCLVGRRQTELGAPIRLGRGFAGDGAVLRVSAATKGEGRTRQCSILKEMANFHWHSPGERNQGAPSLSLSSDPFCHGHGGRGLACRDWDSLGA